MNSFSNLLTKKLIIPLAAVGLLTVSAVPAFAACNPSHRVAVLEGYSGSVTIYKCISNKPYDVYSRMSIDQGDTIVTGPSSYAMLSTASGSVYVPGNSAWSQG